MPATTINYSRDGGGKAAVVYTLRSLELVPVSGQETYVERVLGLVIDDLDFKTIVERATYLGVSQRFIDVIDTFKTPAGHTPAGFRIEVSLQSDGLFQADLIRDISYDADGLKRPTGMIFSADSANPYEVAPIAPLLGNLTCNPGIVYDSFINNPKANVGAKFKTRDEVILELAHILGPGCDVSVELNNPFEDDFNKIIEECETFKEILTGYRLVVKVPHTGPINGTNVHELLTGDKRFSGSYKAPTTEDAFRGHRLALKLREHGYRINFTLMFEPYQSALALQAKPAFINAFMRQRATHSQAFASFVAKFERGRDESVLVELREFLLANDFLAAPDVDHDLLDCLRIARDTITYRHWDSPFGSDGLDSVRHSLRLLRRSNLSDTRLIICSMDGDYNYPDIDNLLADPEYADVVDRVVLTADPVYLARFASTPQVIGYQRKFMNAVAKA
ncbi:MAG: transaldolase [Propionibacteriaceae bacterium]|jgi:hypothetical protein|nr:transaldolase [Propionibacteriaceae bacterium]